MVSERIKRRIETLLDQADEAVAARDWTRARDRAQEVLAFDPNNEEASAFLAASERALAGSQATLESTPQPTPAPTASLPASFASGAL